MEGGSGAGVSLLLLGGALFLKPKDLFTISRTAGRACGSIVVSLRGLRKVASDAIAAESAPSELKGVRESLMSSFKQLEDISRTVSREVAQSSPVAGLRAATTFTPKRTSEPKTSSIASTNDAFSASALKVEAKSTILTTISGSSPQLLGAEIISKVIEEGAFAQQEARILGQQIQDRTQDT